MNFDTISSSEIVNHISSCFLVSVIKDVVFGIHIPLDLMHLIGSVGAVFSHHDSSFKLPVDKIFIMSLESIIY